MIASEPAGAQILVHDSAGKLVSKGKTPLRLELPGGTQQLVARYREWPEKALSVNVILGQETPAAFEFRGSSLTLTSEPSGATVTEGKATLGKTPLTLNDQPPGKRTFSISARDYKTKTVSMTIEAERQANQMVNLEKDPLSAISPELRKWLGTYTAVTGKNLKSANGSLRVFLEDGNVYVEGGAEQTMTGYHWVSHDTWKIPKSHITQSTNVITGHFTDVTEHDENSYDIRTGKRTNKSYGSKFSATWPANEKDTITFVVEATGDVPDTGAILFRKTGGN